jgi:hypothetical protein
MAGVSARIRFSNHLLPSDALPGSSQPLLAGATGRLWASSAGVRLELQADNGDTEVGFDGRKVTLYDVSQSTAYVMAVPQHRTMRSRPQTGVPSVARIRGLLAGLARHITLSGAVPGDTAGQPSYTVRISPTHDGGLLGAVELAFDANRPVPLRIAVMSQGSSTPVLALAATDISFGNVPTADVAVHLASGTRIVHVHPPAAPAAARGSHRRPEVTGAAAVARGVPFRLDAPPTLVGLPRHGVRLVDGAGTPAAVTVYGHGLGAVVLVEQTAARGSGALGSLPRISVNGASGHELATALGTAIQFDRSGVRYTLVGSLPATAAEAAARALG